MIGGIVGSYRLLKELGRGGMGAVYLGEHTIIGRNAAVKLLLPQYSRDPEIVNRFFNEARAATQIRHPGIVEIFDFGYHEDGCAFLVMEFLDGESLTLKLAREGGKLDTLWMTEVARQVASTLRAAHDKGIVHRDLKPDNVFVVPDSDLPMGARIKLLDFGIAKLSGETDPHLKTRTGAVMGTPTYMSPEQCRGAGAVDSRTDVYALGCLMFEMATGRPPYLGQGPGDVMGAHIYSEVPHPSSLTPSLPPALDALIVRMLAKSPDARPRSMLDLLAELERLGFSRPSGRMPSSLAPSQPLAPGRPPTTTLQGAASEVVSPPSLVSPRPPAKRVVWLAPVAALLIAGAAGAWYFARATPATETITVTARAPIPKVDDEAAAKPAAEKAEPNAHALVHLGIDSTPAGAEVFRASDGARLGRTPLSQEVARGGAPVVYLLKMRGFRDAHVTLSLDHDLNEVIAMERHSDSPAKPPANHKPVKNGFLNPFDN